MARRKKLSKKQKAVAEEAIEVIYEIAIGEYSTKMLNKDIIEYYMGNWEYKKEEE